MNPTGNPRTIDDGVLDLLVDGELDEAERRELLARLDETPGGWRQCALAFLEAQCWRQGLGRLRQEAAAGVPIHQGYVGRSENRPHEFSHYKRLFFGGRRGTPLAMAASFLAALVLGVVLRGAMTPDAGPGPEAGQFAGGQSPAPAAPVLPEPESPESGYQPPAAASDAPPQYVTIPVSRPDGSEESVRLPVVQRDTVDEAWLAGLPTAVPDELVQAFRDTGHEVRQQRRLLPLRMRDGRSVVVPYDQVEIRYVGGPAYQ
jgi:hypothetical protein